MRKPSRHAKGTISKGQRRPSCLRGNNRLHDSTAGSNCSKITQAEMAVLAGIALDQAMAQFDRSETGDKTREADYLACALARAAGLPFASFFAQEPGVMPDGFARVASP